LLLSSDVDSLRLGGAGSGVVQLNDAVTVKLMTVIRVRTGGSERKLAAEIEVRGALADSEKPAEAGRSSLPCLARASYARWSALRLTEWKCLALGLSIAWKRLKLGLLIPWKCLALGVVCAPAPAASEAASENVTARVAVICFMVFSFGLVVNFMNTGYEPTHPVSFSVATLKVSSS